MRHRILRPDIAATATLLLVMLAIADESSRSKVLDQGEPTQYFLPLIVSLMTVGLCALDLVARCSQVQPTAGEVVHSTKLFAYIGTLLFICLLVERIGLALLVIVVLPPLLHFIESVRWRTAFAVSFCASTVIFGLFQKLLGVSLPKGTWLQPLFALF